MTTALLLIDVQRDMLDPPNPVPGHAEIRRALECLLESARDARAFVIYVQNDGSPGDPDEPHTPGWDLSFSPLRDDLVIRKSRADSFTNEALGEALASKRIDRVVVAGMQSNYCISATCRGALSRGLKVVLASGAHATYDEGMSASAIADRVEEELVKEGAEVVPFTRIEFI